MEPAIALAAETERLVSTLLWSMPDVRPDDFQVRPYCALPEVKYANADYTSHA